MDSENILDISRNALRPSGYQCEWGASGISDAHCKITLVSWTAYLKHLLLHCYYHGQLKEQGHYQCRLPRCNVPQGLAIFISYDELATHIQESHMTHIPLFCPVIGCHVPKFMRATLLDDHFSNSHNNLISQTFSTSWLPLIPTLDSPPELPYNIPVASILSSNVLGTWSSEPHSTKSVQASVSIRTPLLASPKKHKGMFSIQGEEKVGSCGTPITFDDLVKQSDKNGMWNGNLHVSCLTRHREPYFHLASPQSMLPSQMHVHTHAPQSIGYDMFVKWLETGGDVEEGGEILQSLTLDD